MFISYQYFFLSDLEVKFTRIGDFTWSESDWWTI